MTRESGDYAPGVAAGESTSLRRTLRTRPLEPMPPREAAAVYRAIFERRDMRHFSGGAVAPEVLQRLMLAAHYAPSVGFMQPWRFIRVSDRRLRQQLHALVEAERLKTAEALDERREAFLRLKVEGILEAAEVLVVALAEGREAHLFGRRTMPFMDLASVACAIENLWLAARAEGLGMGWVSLYEPAEVAACLGLPEGAIPVAILCLGPVVGCYKTPMLEQVEWSTRLPLSAVVYENRWGEPAPLAAAPLNPAEILARFTADQGVET